MKKHNWKIKTIRGYRRTFYHMFCSDCGYSSDKISVHDIHKIERLKKDTTCDKRIVEQAVKRICK